MRRNYVGALKIICLGLAALIALRLYQIGGDSPPQSSVVLVDDMEGTTRKEAVRSRAWQSAGKAASLPESYEVIFSSGVFGKLPGEAEEPLPTLVGLADVQTKKYAVFRTANAPSLHIAEGEEKQGIKILRIATNRVLIEYRGEKVELSLFSGLGSDPLLSPKKRK